jgi:hypothetical protein
MSELLMKSARELKVFLAQRTILDPHNELEFLAELLASAELARMQGRAKLEMLEVLWPSINSLLEIFERQINGSRQKQSFAENSLFSDFERLAKLTRKVYTDAALAMHKQAKPWWGEYPREIALIRAIGLSAHIAVMRLSLYIPLENGFWHQLYTLWQEAEQTNLPNQSSRLHSDSSLNAELGEMFMGLSLMGTLSTNALPAQEIKPLLACFVQFSSKTHIYKTKPSDEQPWIGVDFEHDLPPRRYNPSSTDNNVALNHASRFITIEPLVELMQEMLKNFSGDFIYISECAVLISRATLERVISQLQCPLKMRRERPKASGQCYVYSGIEVISNLLSEEFKLGQFTPSPETTFPKLIKEGLDTPPDATNLIEDKASETSPDELWELVGRGHLIYEAPQPHESTSAESLSTTHEHKKRWDIIDVSMDGIRLYANRAKDDPILSIGSLVFVEFPVNMTIDFLIGILRWELNPSPTGHEIGIEILTHNAKPIRVSGSHQNTSSWYAALMLPPSKRSEDSLLVLPNHEYRMGASVMALTPRRESALDAINQHESMLELILGRKILQTASICVFQFQDAREIAELEETTDNTLGTAT